MTSTVSSTSLPKTKFSLLMALFISSLFFLQSPAWSCECSDEEVTFFGLLKEGKLEERNEGTPFKPLIIFGEVISEDNSTRSKVLIKNLIAGELAINQVDIIAGDGGDCGLPTEVYEKGDRKIFILDRPMGEETPSVSTAAATEYQVISCGVNLLNTQEKNGRTQVQGPLNKSQESLLKLKFGDQAEAKLQKWEEEMFEEQEKLQAKFEDNLQKLFKKQYRNEWKKKWDAYQETSSEEEGEVYLAPFKTDYLKLKTELSKDINKTYKEFEENIIQHLESMPLDKFIQEVKSILA